jgi:hypothetical protein
MPETVRIVPEHLSHNVLTRLEHAKDTLRERATLYLPWPSAWCSGSGGEYQCQAVFHGVQHPVVGREPLRHTLGIRRPVERHR